MMGIVASGDCQFIWEHLVFQCKGCGILDRALAGTAQVLATVFEVAKVADLGPQVSLVDLHHRPSGYQAGLERHSEREGRTETNTVSGFIDKLLQVLECIFDNHFLAFIATVSVAEEQDLLWFGSL